MQDGKALSLEQIREFLQASDEIRFKGRGRAAIDAWVARTLRQQRYSRQDRAAKGLLRQYLAKMTGLSRAQITRLIRQCQQGGEIQPARYRRHRFASKYTPADVALLAAVDEAHETLSGPATRKILEREYQLYKQSEFERLAGISVAHLYRLRRRSSYRQRRLHFTKTRPTAVSIGERRRPNPRGQPGYLRVDTVHQGDLDGVKGVYHINALDEVTQWQVVGAAHGLAESKNGAVIRKHMGHAHIAAPHAARIQRFFQQHFNPYLNFHRPCRQPELITDAKGKQKRLYRHYQTPWETFQKAPQAAGYLKPGQTIEALERLAKVESDTAAARQMQRAKSKLFARFADAKTPR